MTINSKEEYLAKVKKKYICIYVIHTCADKYLGDIKVSLPIKTDANLHLQQERSQPDPIMLLAAAAAVIDDEGKYKKRAYERREIKLHGRHGKEGQRYT